MTDTGKDSSEEKGSCDPSGRYQKTGALIDQSRGTKHVYKAFDTETAVEVAWQEYWNLSVQVLNAMERHMGVLKELNHPNVVKYHEGWVDRKERKVVLITEAMPSGKGSISNVRKFLSRNVQMKSGVLVGWLFQVLDGLHFLHNQNPCFVHRDLRCENIYIRSNVGRLKIGALELGIFMQASHPAAFPGTPGYMALDLVNTTPDTLTDVYAFGMCALEMFTAKYPYSECATAHQIFASQLKGHYPEAILTIADGAVVDMIERCLASRERRMTTDELFLHPLFTEVLQQDDYSLPENLKARQAVQWEDDGTSSLAGMLASLPTDRQPQAAVAELVQEKAKESVEEELDLTASAVGDNIKCYTEDKGSCIRIFYRDIVSIESLRNIIQQDLDIPDIRLKYLDTDGDLVNVTQRTTLMELVRYAQSLQAFVLKT